MKPNIVKIPVRTKKGGLRYCLVDSLDSHLREFTWSEGNGTAAYPRRSTKRRLEDGREKTVTIYLHREIAGLEPGDATFQVHHANHDVYDCRRVNLWVCTPGFNARHQKRALGTMLEELVRVEAHEVECWPLAHPDVALLHLLQLHVERRGRPLRHIVPALHAKLQTPPIPGDYAVRIANEPPRSSPTRKSYTIPRAYRALLGSEGHGG